MALEKIKTAIQSIADDENLNLEEHAETFVAIFEFIEEASNAMAEQLSANEALQTNVSDLKSSNWDLSQKITAQSKNEDDGDFDEGDDGDGEEEQEQYETLDEAIESLFKEEEED